MNTKFALSALGLAMLIATPAFAQKPAHRAAPAPYASAAAPVIADGQYVGADPDPSIRFELQRDSATYTTSN
jgi:hypothetical protein